MLRRVHLLTICGALALAACSGARPPERAVAAGPVHFVQETQPSEVSLTASAQGRLELDGQGCLRLKGHVLIWPAEAALDLSEPGVVKIRDRRSRAAVRVGEQVALGGGAYGGYVPQTNRPIAPCNGPLLNVDSFGPARA